MSVAAVAIHLPPVHHFSVVGNANCPTVDLFVGAGGRENGDALQQAVVRRAVVAILHGRGGGLGEHVPVHPELVEHAFELEKCDFLMIFKIR